MSSVHALSPGVTLLDLLRSERGLFEAGDRALTSPSAVRRYADVRLRAPLPDPPTVPGLHDVRASRRGSRPPGR